MAGVSSEDIVIYTTPTCKVMGTGSDLTQPPQPGAFSGAVGGGGFGSGGVGFSGGGGFGGGGDGGGGGGSSGSGSSFSGHGRLGCKRKAPPESFGVLPCSRPFCLS